MIACRVSQCKKYFDVQYEAFFIWDKYIHLAICLHLMEPHWNFAGKKVLLTSVGVMDEVGCLAVFEIVLELFPGVGPEEAVGDQIDVPVMMKPKWLLIPKVNVDGHTKHRSIKASVVVKLSLSCRLMTWRSWVRISQPSIISK